MGTRSFSLDFPGAFVRSCSTVDYQLLAISANKKATGMYTVIRNQIVDITHDLLVTLMGSRSEGEKAFVVVIVDGSGMGMQHERDSQKALDPFDLGSSASRPWVPVCLSAYQLVPTVGLPRGRAVSVEDPGI